MKNNLLIKRNSYFRIESNRESKFSDQYSKLAIFKVDSFGGNDPGDRLMCCSRYK